MCIPATTPNSRHAAGSVGIENVAPLDVQRSLRLATISFGPKRREFSLEDLKEHGLACDSGEQEQVRKAAYLSELMATSG